MVTGGAYSHWFESEVNAEKAKFEKFILLNTKERELM